MIGSIGFMDDPKRQNFKARMIGYAMSENFWGQGLMTEAANEVLKFGFESLGLEVISAYCYPRNARSKRVIIKCGFEFEGTLRKCEKVYNGDVFDNECYSILKSNYKKQ